MPIRLHVRHALGEEAVVREERDGATPLLFGRSREADVVVPSMGVAGRHCAIFFDASSGKWLVQDGNTRGRTAVNGVALAGSRHPCPLLAGFVVTLGDGQTPASIRVESIAATPASPTSPPVSEDPVDRPEIAVVDEDDDADEAEPAFHDEVEFGLPALDAARRPRRVATGPSVTSIVGAMLALGLIVVLIVFVARERTPSRPPAVAQRSPAPAVEPEVSETPSILPETRPTIDLEVVPDPSIETTAERDDRLADPAGERGVVAGLSPLDPLRASSAWAEVISAEGASDAAVVIDAYLDFLDLPPQRTGVLRGEVEARLERQVDALWWRRIEDLLDEEFAVVDRALAAELRLRNLPRDAAPGEAGALRERLTADADRLENINAELTDEMQHLSGERPNLADADQLRRLRDRRDPAVYERWRAGLLDVVRYQGRLPWDEETAATTRPASRPVEDAS